MDLRNDALVVHVSVLFAAHRPRKARRVVRSRGVAGLFCFFGWGYLSAIHKILGFVVSLSIQTLFIRSLSG